MVTAETKSVGLGALTHGIKQNSHQRADDQNFQQAASKLSEETAKTRN